MSVTANYCNIFCLYVCFDGSLGNKGAVGVSFMFNGTSFGFVNCHLTSGNEKIARYLPQSYTHTHYVYGGFFQVYNISCFVGTE